MTGAEGEPKVRRTVLGDVRMRACFAAALAVAIAGVWTDRAFAAIVSMETLFNKETLSGPFAGALISDLPHFAAERTGLQVPEAASGRRFRAPPRQGLSAAALAAPAIALASAEPSEPPVSEFESPPTPVPTPPAAPLILLGLVAFAVARSFGPRGKPRKPPR